MSMPWIRACSLAAVLCLSACQPAEPFLARDISGSPIGGEFALQDETGRTRHLADFSGKVVVIFFGYTHCPDVCPTILAELAASLNQLGADAKRVQVLFVTADPARDTAAVMAKYTHAFHPSFIGLRATGAPLAKFTSDYKLFAEAVGTGKDYPVDHTANAYVLDATGKIRLFAPSGFGVANWTHDLKLLIQESPAP